MKLFHAATSPYVRKVMVLLEETGQLDKVTLVPVATTPIAPAADLKASNPLAKIPALMLDDGATIYDSRVICAYLDDLGGGTMYPASGPQKWEMLTLEATADGIMDSAIVMAYEVRMRPQDKQWSDWIEGQWGKVAGGISALNDRWMGHLNGPLNIGQIAVGCALGYVDLRHDARNWRKDNPALADWYKTFESRPSMVSTRPPAA